MPFQIADASETCLETCALMAAVSSMPGAIGSRGTRTPGRLVAPGVLFWWYDGGLPDVDVRMETVGWQTVPVKNNAGDRLGLGRVHPRQDGSGHSFRQLGNNLDN